jgi:hypothetical protein
MTTIHIGCLYGRTLTLAVNLTDTVVSVKEKIEAAWDFPFVEQHLVYKGKELWNEDERGAVQRTLADYHVSSDATMHVVLRMSSVSVE